MTELKKMQILHERAVTGETLTPEEHNALQKWYEKLDSEENTILNGENRSTNLEQLHQNLEDISNQTTKVSQEVKTLISQNENLKKENKILKQKIEFNLTEKVA